MSMGLATIWPLSFLVVAVIDDLVFKKFHNWLFIVLTILGALSVFTFLDADPIQSLGGFVVGGLLFLPLVLMGATGAGDMKFMMCFGILMGTIKTFEIFVYALFWGALIGVLQAALAGRLNHLWNNLFGMALRVKPNQTHKIPYTVAILFGWMTYMTAGSLLW